MFVLFAVDRCQSCDDLLAVDVGIVPQHPYRTNSFRDVDHNVHFLGYNIFDVSYAVIVDEAISEKRLAEAVDLGRQVMEKFRAG